MSLSNFQRSLAAMPARQLNLVAVGAVAIVAALALSALRAPLSNLRAQGARLAALKAAPQFASSTPPAPAAPPRPVVMPTPLALIAAVSASARAAGVTVASAVPGAQNTVAGLRRQTLDVEASGGYGAILDWIAAIEAKQPAVGVVRLELKPAPDQPRRQVHLQLAAYSTGSQP
ncbi:GspMb/PilO family protein [Massilia sp. 9096]|uniref:GspMb/PilO family protein n=1 Tax=Massilia sp. 9096 TaxID=1500894 RepID=UPI000564C9FF|nr:GspMb/PilO family protein [Massilia sp. 9096]